MEGKRDGASEWFEDLEERDRGWQKRERWKRIGKSRYNRWYKEVKGEEIPGYLKKGWGESRWNRVARFRMGNEMGERKYWEDREGRECRLCGGETKTWEHVWEGCGIGGIRGRRVGRKRAVGYWGMRRLERERREGE